MNSDGFAALWGNAAASRAVPASFAVAASVIAAKSTSSDGALSVERADDLAGPAFRPGGGRFGFATLRGVGFDFFWGGAGRLRVGMPHLLTRHTGEREGVNLTKVAQIRLRPVPAQRARGASAEPWPGSVPCTTLAAVQMPSATQKNNVHVTGTGTTPMIFAHGYGCDQNMWRLVAPAFMDRYRVILFDLMGCGKSDLSAYDRKKYGSLAGHADDVLQILEEVTDAPAVFVGHSVSAMIGVLAELAAPQRFESMVMIGPSPCYINHDDYVGGFTQQDIDSLLDTLDSNYLGWASAMAPTIMGAPDRPELQRELTNSFCATDPEIAKHFAHVTFRSDNRADLPKVSTRSLILQCSDDIIAPRSVGSYMNAVMPKSTLHVIDNVGHCPHLSSPAAIVSAMNAFL